MDTSVSDVSWFTGIRRPRGEDWRKTICNWFGETPWICYGWYFAHICRFTVHYLVGKFPATIWCFRRLYKVIFRFNDALICSNHNNIVRINGIYWLNISGSEGYQFWVSSKYCLLGFLFGNIDYSSEFHFRALHLTAWKPRLIGLY